MSDRKAEGLGWFYVREGRREGPFDRRRLLEALLLLDAPERALVWRSGLRAWAAAGALDELRHELPPPVPRAVSLGEPEQAPAPLPPLPTENGTVETPDEAQTETEDEGDLATAEEPPAQTGTDEAARRRRHRKRRYRESSLRPYALRLVVILALLALVLWLLLRRLDEAPAGSIIIKESTDAAPGPAPPAAFNSRTPLPPPRSSWGRW